MSRRSRACSSPSPASTYGTASTWPRARSSGPSPGSPRTHDAARARLAAADRGDPLDPQGDRLRAEAGRGGRARRLARGEPVRGRGPRRARRGRRDRGRELVPPRAPRRAEGASALRSPPAARRRLHPALARPAEPARPASRDRAPGREAPAAHRPHRGDRRHAGRRHQARPRAGRGLLTVDDRDLLATRFEEHRGHLRAVAYRMLGSAGEADDAVQEAWLRLSRADAAAVENLGGWLTTVVARVCLDMLRARTSRREEELDTQITASPVSGEGWRD